jgi:hypothetical protein
LWSVYREVQVGLTREQQLGFRGVASRPYREQATVVVYREVQVGLTGERLLGFRGVIQ